jgi:hypothetical protein
MEPGRVCPQNSSRPSASVITSALTMLARALPETNRCRPARPAAGRRTRTSVASSRPTRPRWFIDDTQLAQLVADNRIGRSMAYRYLHEGIDALAAARGCAARWLPAPPGTRA